MFDVLSFVVWLYADEKENEKKTKKKMKKIFIIENLFISWFANEKVCDFFVIENSEIDVVLLCLNMNWLFFFIYSSEIQIFFYDCVWILNFFESEKMNVYFKKTN